MAAKELIFSTGARGEIAKGLNLLANAVRITLGPRGRNVVIEKSWGAPTVTKDGVTVAKEIELENKFQNMGAQMVKEVASKTSDVAGDGTTTATVLAQAIYNEGAKLVELRGVDEGGDLLLGTHLISYANEAFESSKVVQSFNNGRLGLMVSPIPGSGNGARAVLTLSFRRRVQMRGAFARVWRLIRVTRPPEEIRCRCHCEVGAA